DRRGATRCRPVFLRDWQSCAKSTLLTPATLLYFRRDRPRAMPLPPLRLALGPDALAANNFPASNAAPVTAIRYKAGTSFRIRPTKARFASCPSPPFLA